ncbi:hypothetical protein [Pontibacter harenae]|uniref:hypothetical protein n=1 Tax=Pontibacter harenae TaxID=2894083 RepID=UPI001E4AE803|nr:hypothetical protein [Pontibacter harenae]MCC9166035.1 hypothetical protein [Pontibacter harenae]
MQYTPALLSSASNHLQKIFNVEVRHTKSLEELLYQLSDVVHHLLQHDLPRLLHILYRVDVDERKVKEALTANSEEVIAERITRLIIKRELQKAQIRFRYSNN